MSDLVQVHNREMVDLLSADLQPRAEPNFAWKSACSQYQALSNLRGFWPMSSVDNGADVYDLSAQGRTLTNAGDTVVFGYDNLAPYGEFNDSSSTLSAANAAWQQITGAEAYVAAGLGGVTLGGWFYPDDATGATEYLMAKFLNVGNGSYYLHREAAGTVKAAIVSGGAEISATSTVLMTQSAWQFVCLRYFRDTRTITAWLDDATVSSAPGAAANIDVSDRPFYVGRASPAADYYDGKASLCFLCACALSDALVWSLFQQSRSMFGA